MSATMTSEGYIPHLKVRTPAGSILAPVKLQLDESGCIRVARSGSTRSRMPSPLRRDGKLVFALPGGAEVLA